jgi:hypothetical protein
MSNKLLQNINGWTQSGPSGNDKQFLGLALGAGLSIAGNYLSNRTDNIPGALSSQDLSYHFDPVREQLTGMGTGIDTMKEGIGRTEGLIGQMQQGYGQMQGLAQGLMDPRSAANQSQANLMQTQGANQMAMQALLNRRASAARGGGGNSGLMAAQERASQRAMGSNLLSQFQNQMQQNRMAGINLAGQNQGLLQNIAGVEGMRHGIAGDITGAYGNIADREMLISENMAQAEIAKRKYDQNMARWKNQQQGGMLSGIGGEVTKLFVSDESLKKNIMLIGKSNSGINIYKFEYKDKKYGDGLYQGVLSNEVPWAVTKSNNGYDMVDYSKTDVTFKRI